METTGDAYFTYSWPVVNEIGVMVFDHKTVLFKTDPERAIEVLAKAAECLEGPEPESDPSCGYCSYVAKRAYRIKK